MKDKLISTQSVPAVASGTTVPSVLIVIKVGFITPLAAEILGISSVAGGRHVTCNVKIEVPGVPLFIMPCMKTCPPTLQYPQLANPNAMLTQLFVSVGTTGCIDP